MRGFHQSLRHCVTVAMVLMVLRRSAANPLNVNVDWMPGVSQLKSLVQAVSGDTDGAKKTQETFLRTAPVVSQVNSLWNAAAGRSDEAKKIQKDFYDAHVTNNRENLHTGMSVVGDIVSGRQDAAVKKLAEAYLS